MSPMIAVLTLCAAFMAAEADAKEPAEITIHIRGEHKAVISALLAAVDGGTTVTGIAELDSVAATYGLMGIDRKGRSSGFYGYRFRLTFPPGSDRAAMAGAYWNLAYIQSVEPEPPPEAWETSSQRPAGQETTNTTVVKKQGSSFLRGSLRVVKKVASGTIVGIVFSGIVLGGSRSAGGDSGIGAAAAGYAAFGLGYPIGVYAVDARESSFWLTLIGGGLGWWGAAKLSERVAWVTFFGAPVLASELSRKDAVTGGPKRPKQSQDLRFSLGLVPEFQGGLSAVATLRF